MKFIIHKERIGRGRGRMSFRLIDPRTNQYYRSEGVVDVFWTLEQAQQRAKDLQAKLDARQLAA